MYPDVEDVIGGKIMMGCWTKQYVTAGDFLRTQRVEMQCVNTNEDLLHSPCLDRPSIARPPLQF